MRSLPRPAAAFVIAVVGFGAIVLARSTAHLSARLAEGGWALAEVAVFLALAVLAELRRLPLGLQSFVSVGCAVNCAAAIVLGPEVASWTAALAMGLGDVVRRSPAYRAAFNAATIGLAVAAGGHAFDALRAQSGGALAEYALPALAAYAAANLLVNQALVCTAIGLATRVSPWEAAQANLRDLIVTMLALYPLGLLLAVSHDALGPWIGLAVLAVPTIAIYRGLAAARELRIQAREALEALADALDRRDRYTDQHSRRVAGYAAQIAAGLRLPLAERETVVAAARLHDLGKIHVPDAVLRKEGPLTDEEWGVMRAHPEVGAAILRRLRMYRESAELVARHHERLDGHGYPAGLSADALSRGAQILAVADAYDAMTSDRPYRAGMPAAIALARLRSGAGTQFAPAAVEALAASLGHPVAAQTAETADESEAAAGGPAAPALATPATA